MFPGGVQRCAGGRAGAARAALAAGPHLLHRPTKTTFVCFRGGTCYTVLQRRYLFASLSAKAQPSYKDDICLLPYPQIPVPQSYEDYIYLLTYPNLIHSPIC
jgi:hypothetical protein